MTRTIKPWLVLLFIVALAGAPATGCSQDSKPAADTKSGEETKPPESAEPAGKADDAKSGMGCCCLEQKPDSDNWKCAADAMEEPVCKAAAGAYKRKFRWNAGECEND